MVKWSHKGMCTSNFWILRIHNCFKNKPFLPALVIQAPGDFSHLILPYMLPSQDSRFSALLEERTRNMEEFDQVPSQFPSCSAAIPEARHPVTFPAREKQKRNHFQRLCGLLGFCSGAVATDGRLPESRQHCTEKEDGKELTFRIVQAQQTSTEPL